MIILTFLKKVVSCRKRKMYMHTYNNLFHEKIKERYNIYTISEKDIQIHWICLNMFCFLQNFDNLKNLVFGDCMLKRF